MGYPNVFGPAPSPLTAAEWRTGGGAGPARLREFVRLHIGMRSRFVTFEPEGSWKSSSTHHDRSEEWAS
jgi:hypothetical protein